MNITDDEEFLSHFQGEILEGIVDLLVLHSEDVSDFGSVPIGPSLVMSALSTITQDEAKWTHAIQYIVRKMPSYAIVVINEMIKEMPCPSAATVGEVFALQYQLSELRSDSFFYYRKLDVNICAVLGCLAHKMAGVFSEEIFTTNVWNYLLRFLIHRRSPLQILMALIAIEKFAITSENKIKIVAAFQQMNQNPLINLMDFLTSEDYIQYQVGFCARWALDNTFTVPGRDPTYLSVDMSGINVTLSQCTGYFMKISPDGLEVRCDTNEYGTVRATGEACLGSWYYETSLVSLGPMRIGFASSKADMSDDYVVGSDANSVGYDGSVKCLWTNSEKQTLDDPPFWKAGDVVGFFINIDQKTIYLVLEDTTIMTTAPDLFDDDLACGTETSYFPVVTLAPYQQCRFNFGAKPFVHTPPEANFSTFNAACQLAAEEKMVKSKTTFQSENSNFNESSDACILCYDNIADTKLLPCGHTCFCKSCAGKLQICPVCCADIDNRV
ncbi:PREDICTED: RING finger and SPRY domain-containing protein 1-like [Papilio polytes]|uniref:RING finger and SPRY domain-containing protein 1-like n=1 Tax=Papilio polytes TaxID=76194 RepID=UPI000675DDE8|nr:PREDICTED: RING finger and SPRY domain-containing protein 1-like [Papilio polytes]